MERIERVDAFLNREWLILVGCLLSGLFVVPFVLSLALKLLSLKSFYSGLLAGGFHWSWLLLLAPYALSVAARLAISWRARRARPAPAPAPQAAPEPRPAGA